MGFIKPQGLRVWADEIDAGWTGATGIGAMTDSLSGPKLGPGFVGCDRGETWWWVGINTTGTRAGM